MRYLLLLPYLREIVGGILDGRLIARAEREGGILILRCSFVEQGTGRQVGFIRRAYLAPDRARTVLTKGDKG